MFSTNGNMFHPIQPSNKQFFISTLLVGMDYLLQFLNFKLSKFVKISHHCALTVIIQEVVNCPWYTFSNFKSFSNSFRCFSRKDGLQLTFFTSFYCQGGLSEGCFLQQRNTFMKVIETNLRIVSLSPLLFYSTIIFGSHP